MNSPHPSSEEIFHRLLDESSALLASAESGGIVIPDDELHREIIIPLLPAMLADAAIRGHWSEQHATGFVARIGRHFANGDPAPRWHPGDFEIHVTASYSAGADARALADTLLSEESLREMTAALMNQLLDVLWPSLAPVPVAPPAEAKAGSQIAAAEISATHEAILPAETKPEPEQEPAITPLTEAEPEILPSAILPSAIEAERAGQIQPAELPAAHQVPSRVRIRALCGRLAASAVQRGMIGNRAHGASAAIIARRIVLRTKTAQKKKRPGSRTARLG